jgi:hypothetical protein
LEQRKFLRKVHLPWIWQQSLHWKDVIRKLLFVLLESGHD